MNKTAILASAITASLLASPASAATFIVSSRTGDLWSAAGPARFSDTGGLVGDRLAIAANDPGQAAARDNRGEIAFSVSAIPEVATWAMMLGGFAAVGRSMRRRKNVRIHFS